MAAPNPLPHSWLFPRLTTTLGLSVSCTIHIPRGLCLCSPARIPSRQMFSATGSPGSSAPSAEGASLSGHLPSWASASLRDKGEPCYLHSDLEWGAGGGVLLCLLRSHQLLLPLLPQVTTPRKSVLLSFPKGWQHMSHGVCLPCPMCSPGRSVW